MTYLVTTETYQTPYQQFENEQSFYDISHRSAHFIDHHVQAYRTATPDCQITMSGKINGEGHLDYQAFDKTHHQIVAHAIVDRIA